jgi:hypothetical protein
MSGNPSTSAMLGEVQVAAIRLRLAGKCGLQIFVGLRTFQLSCHLFDSLDFSIQVEDLKLAAYTRRNDLGN